MIKLIIQYSHPDEHELFYKRYDEHIGIVKKIPGLAGFTVSKPTNAPFPLEPDYALIAEMHFANRADFELAMASPENRAAGKDAREFAKGLTSMIVVEQTEIEL